MYIEMDSENSVFLLSPSIKQLNYLESGGRGH
jgi:hypothetical protein